MEFIQHTLFSGKRILLGVTGSIAAYKIVHLTRLLVKMGAEVKLIMTESATDFVSPLVLETLSKNKVLHQLSDAGTWSNHVMLGRWADVMLVAPASCNSIAKMANGLCDNLLLATYLSATCPVMLSPAMDEDMWTHPSTRRNLKVLTEHGVKVLGVASGELASGLVGEGRMLEPEQLVDELASHFSSHQDLLGKKAIVTAGPTYEPIDPVRFVGNHSSGRMGVEIASALASRGAITTLVLGPSAIKVPDGINLIRVMTAIEMAAAVETKFSEMDIAVMAAAVADYRPSTIAPEKLKKFDEELQITLVKNPDILKYCGEHKRNNQIVVGFALETTNEVANAKAKLVAKKADMIVLNSLKDTESGFGTATNKISIFEKGGAEHHYPLESKSLVAKRIIDLIVERIA